MIKVRGSVATGVAGAMMVSGCASSGGLGGAPTLSRPPDRAVVQLSDIINNVKCDMLAFIKGNHVVNDRGAVMGGTLKLTVDRSHTVGGGIKVVGVPIVEGVTLGGKAAGQNLNSFGEIVSTPFTVFYDPNDPGQDVSCDPENRTVGVVEPGSNEVVQQRLTAPLLDLAGLRDQLDRIRGGKPKVRFADFNFTGSVVLTRSRDTGLDINVLWLNPSFTNAVASTFKIEYNIGTNWQQILQDAHYDTTPAGGAPCGGVTHDKILVLGGEAGCLPHGTTPDLSATIGTIAGLGEAPRTRPAPAPATRASWLARIKACEDRAAHAGVATGAARAVCRRDPASYAR